MSQFHVTNEWGPLRKALVDDARNVIDIEDQAILVSSEELRKHPEAGPICRDLFQRQQDSLRRLLNHAGVELIQPVSVEQAVCQVFTRDPAFVVGEELYAGRMRDEYRRDECTVGIAATFREAEFVTLTNGVIEGGDILILDDSRLLAGTGDITDAAGVECLRKSLRHCQQVVDVIQVPHQALHLDCCLAPLPNGKSLISCDRLPLESIEILQPHFIELIALDQQEALINLSANLLWLNPETVVSTNAAQRTNSLLRGMGFEVIELEFDQPVSLWGSVRCAVCPLVRE